MTEVQRITDQLHRAFYSEAWHGPSVMESLDKLTAAQAAKRPIKSAHSIWEITLHIGAWIDAVRRRVLGEKVELDDTQDWPPVKNTSDEAWQETLAELKRRHEALEKVVAALNEAQLEQLAPSRTTTIYFLIHGLVQHDLYHAGQIAILKRGL
ncbi:MAG: DinB family protein [Candidatus Zixiibacteriota bacterium]